MILADDTPWRSRRGSLVDALRGAYRAMVPDEMPTELKRLVARLDDPEARRESGAPLALVAEADGEHRALATALLEETDLRVVECASAEAALAVLVNESDSTVFLLADSELAGDRDAEALATAVRMLWPRIHVAVASQGPEAHRRIDPSGVVRLSRPWRGLDVLVEAERALSRVA